MVSWMRPQIKYIAWVAERWMYKILRKTAFIGLPLCLLAIVVYTYSKSPTHDRNWKVEHGILPEAEINGNELTVKNIRTFTYTPTGEIETPAFIFCATKASLKSFSTVEAKKIIHKSYFQILIT